MGSERSRPRRGVVREALSVIVINAVPMVGVLVLDWRVAEVLLLYWFETALLLLVLPLLGYVFYGAVGAFAGLMTVVTSTPFVAAGAFFLVGLLYGVDWESVEGGPIFWSAPAVGEPADWFAQAIQDIPATGLAIVAVVVIVNLICDCRRARHERATADEGFEAHALRVDGRVMALQLAVIFGGAAILLAGGGIGLLLLLVLLKTVFELLRLIRRARVPDEGKSRATAGTEADRR